MCQYFKGAESAVREAAGRISQADTAFILAFCSARYDLDADSALYEAKRAGKNRFAKYKKP